MAPWIGMSMGFGVRPAWLPALPLANHIAWARPSTSLRFSHLYNGHAVGSHFISGGIRKKIMLIKLLALLVRVLQGNQTNRIHTCIHTHKHKYTDIRKRRFIVAIGLHDYEGWEGPQSVISKLETQESQQCNSSLSAKAWEPGELASFEVMQSH